MKLTKPVMACAALLSFLFLTASALAQSYRAQIRGLVTDNSGAVLPGATVTLSNVNTGVNVTRQSDTEGLYIFDYFNAGTYRITVTLAGFGDYGARKRPGSIRR